MMITIKCDNCSKFLEIPDQYRGQTGKCNGCGAPILVPKSYVAQVPAWKMGCLYAFLGVMALSFVASIFDSDQSSSRDVVPTPVVESTPPAEKPNVPVLSEREVQKIEAEVRQKLAPENKINLAKFNQIQQGMTYQQVVSILGEEGEVMSENSFGSGQYSVHTIMYVWRAGFMANMNCMFQNGRLVSKSQLGLR